MNATTAPTRSSIAPPPVPDAHIDVLLRALSGAAADDSVIERRAGLTRDERSMALFEARRRGLVEPWRKSKWYAGVWQLTDAGRARMAELEDAMQDVEAPDNGQIDEHAEFLVSAREGRALALREERAAIVEDYELGFEWRLIADEALADEGEWLRLIVARQRDAQTHASALQALMLVAQRELSALKVQLAEAEAGKRATEKALEAALGVTGDLDRQATALITERDLVRRENRALREERDTLCAKLDAANARIAALENAALLDAPDEDAEMTPGAVRLDRASERPHYNMAPPRRTPPAA